MRIGVISDTHDDMPNLEIALEILEGEGITMLLHCGDLSSPEIVEALSGFDVWIARGNVDHHPELEQTAAEVIGNGRLAERHRLTLEGRSAVMVHGHRRGELRSLINQGKHAYVFHGHTHRRRDETIGPTRVINPGALGGMRWQQRSFCILDLDSDRVTFIEI
ncbi:MAG: metallophosphoesterase family protein [Chloroflexota bacterium]|nr:metallophosphoesterase family protein [Chloroflexota bacterium]